MPVQYSSCPSIFWSRYFSAFLGLFKGRKFTTRAGISGSLKGTYIVQRDGMILLMAIHLGTIHSIVRVEQACVLHWCTHCNTYIITLFIFVLICEILATPSQCNAKIHPTNQNGIDIIWAFSTITTLLPLSDTGTNMPFPSCKPPGLLLFINLSIIELQPVLLEQLASRGLEDPLVSCRHHSMMISTKNSTASTSFVASSLQCLQ